MRPSEVMKFLRQFTVLVQRNLRLIANDKLLLASLVLQAPFMVFVIQLEGVSYFTPHRQMDPAFADALEEAVRCGVAALAYDCTVEPDGLTIRNPVEVVL